MGRRIESGGEAGARPPRTLSRWALASLLVETALLVACAAAGAQGAREGRPGAVPARDREEAFRSLGIEVVALRLTASGTMLDLRYKVVDPPRAKAFLGKGAKPLLVDPRTGATLTVPTTAYVGALRQTAVVPQAGKVYFVLFGNTSRSVKAGDVVTLVLGEKRIDGLVVS